MGNYSEASKVKEESGTNSWVKRGYVACPHPPNRLHSQVGRAQAAQSVS